MTGALQRTSRRGRPLRRPSGRLLAALLVAFAAALTGCSSFRVSVDYDLNMDFSEWKSWAWLPEWPDQSDDPRIQNGLLDARVRNAVELALTERGFVQVEEDEADFLVAYHVGLEQRIDVQTVHESSHYARRGWSGTVGTTTNVSQYEQGTLLLDVLEPEDRRLVWRGSTNARVREFAEPQEREERINAAAKSVLSRFPPR